VFLLYIKLLAAYKKADGKKIDGKRVVVDIERGRTIEGWKPRRLGGGKGGRKTGEVRSSGRDESDTKGLNRERKGSRERKRSRSRSRDRRRRSRSKGKSNLTFNFKNVLN
jgi:U1 small nuclear ribonucleoprotein